MSRLDEAGESQCGVDPSDPSAAGGGALLAWNNEKPRKATSSMPALACLISRRVEVWRYQGQRSSDVSKECVLS